MMEQAWFEMADIRRRKYSSAVWIPLRSAQRIGEEGRYGHEGFKEEFIGAGSVAVSLENKDEALKLGWSEIGIGRPHQGWTTDDGYIPADLYEWGKPIGTALALEQHFNGAEHSEWHLHQDLVLTLGLLREGDRWLCPSEDYTEVARLCRSADDGPVLLEIKQEFLGDYLCARRMGLYITAYRSRREIVGDASHIKWETDSVKEESAGNLWEGRVWAIDERGRPYGSKTRVLHIARTDIDAAEDTPVLSVPADKDTTSNSWDVEHKGEKFFSIMGEYWYNEWLPPSQYSPRVRGDKTPGSVFFTTESSGKKETKETLLNAGRWLWFRPEVIVTLSDRRGGWLNWYTQHTGAVSCSPGHGVHFGVNPLGLITIYAKDIVSLPEWQQRIWAGFNITPEGGVAEELLASQVRADPANTTAPEASFVEFLMELDKAFSELYGNPLLRSHPQQSEILKRIHRFRASDRKGLYALAKDIARLTADSIDVGILHNIVAPPKNKTWGSLKSLENVLATIIDLKDAHALLTPLVGVYSLRLADAHLPQNDIDSALTMCAINASAPPVLQGFQLIKKCAETLAAISEIFAFYHASRASTG